MPASTLTASAAASVGATGAVATPTSALHTLSFILFFVGCFAVMTLIVIGAVGRVNRPADVAFMDGMQVGYDKGWFEGRRCAKLSVIGGESEQAS